MKQVICVRGQAGDAPSSSVTSFATPTQTLAHVTTEADVQCAWPTAGVFSNWVMNFLIAPGIGKSWTITLRKNGVDTALTVTISDTAQTARDTTHSVTFAPGDLISFKVVPSGTPSTSGLSAGVCSSIDFNSTNAKESGYANQPTTPSNSATNWNGVFAGFTYNATSGPTTQNVVAAAGTITALYGNTNGAPGAGTSYAITIYKNGVKQDGSGGTANTTVTISGASATSGNSAFSLAVLPGDTLYLECVPSGTPTVRQVGWGVRFLATTDGQSQLCSLNLGTTNTVNPCFSLPNSWDDAWATSETNANDLFGGVSQFSISGLQVILSGSPGVGKSYTIQARRNASSPSGTPSVVISNSATVGSDTSGDSVAISDTDRWSMLCSPGSTPTLRSCLFSAIQTVSVPTGTGDVTFDVDQAAGSGSVTFPPLSGTGAVAFGVDAIVAVGSVTYPPISGSGSLVIGPPIISGIGTFSPIRLTQQGRYAVTAENAPKGRLTQFGRFAVTKEAGPSARLTQMGRQVLYRFVCHGEGPTPPIDIPVHVLASQLIPRWKLERYDIKPRIEERRAGNPIGGPRTPTWAPDGLRWKLYRMDIAPTNQERA